MKLSGKESGRTLHIQQTNEGYFILVQREKFGHSVGARTSRWEETRITLECDEAIRLLRFVQENVNAG